MPHRERFTASDAALVVVDLQEKLLAALPDRNLIVANALRLIQAARLLQIPVVGTEQNPSRLGPTAPSVAEWLPHPTPKMSFRATDFSAMGDRHATLIGIEAHVCVMQTALELLAREHRVQVVADAVGSRSRYDGEVALRRLENAGAVVTTAEAVLFEWIESADHPQFKAISALVKSFSRPPERPVP